MEFSLKLQEKTGKSYLSYSSIKHALTDMRAFELYMAGKLKKESPALTFGSMYDMMLFEPDKAKATYQVIDHDQIMEKMSDRVKALKNPKSSSEYKAAVQQIKTEAVEEDKHLVEESEWKTAHFMVKRLIDSGIKDGYMMGDYQVEFNEFIDDIPVRGFFDCKGAEYVSDSKSTRSIPGFKYDVNKFSYDIQAYIYTQVAGLDDFFWVAQEKTYPYPVAVYKAKEETILRGQFKFEHAVAKIKDWLFLDKPVVNDYIYEEI
jgi:hypothetical protein